MKHALLTACFLLFAGGLSAQKLDPVQWTLTSDISAAPPGTLVPLKLSATIEPGWHIYSLTIQKTKEGPLPTTARIADNPAVESYKIYQPKAERKLDKTIGLDT